MCSLEHFFEVRPVQEFTVLVDSTLVLCVSTFLSYILKMNRQLFIKRKAFKNFMELGLEKTLLNFKKKLGGMFCESHLSTKK